MAARRLLANLAIVCLCAIVLAALPAAPPLRQLAGLDIDILHALDHALGREAQDAGASRVAVVAIDEATHRAPPFAGLPKVMWTPQIADVQNALLAGGARVIGWDLILPTSASTYVADRKFDVPLLKSLAAARDGDRVILGTASFPGGAISPHGLFAWSAGGAANLRSLNLEPDAGGVARRMPVFFPLAEAGDGAERWQPSLALEMAARALSLSPERMPGGGLSLGGEKVAGVEDDRLVINFASAGARIPAYSFADLHACAQAGGTRFFAEHFAGKAVLIGLVLDIEDRKLASNRFYTDGGLPGPAPRCARDGEAPRKPVPAIARATTPGVYLHAAAIDNLLTWSALRAFTPMHRAAMTGLLALLAGAAVLWLPLALAAGLTIAAGAAWTGLALCLFADARLLPLTAPLLAALAAFMILLAVRFAWLDRQGRFLRRAFSSYVSPALVEQLVANPERLKLGGERREMSFLFTDLAGFTGMIEKLEPEQAVILLNRYLDHMIDIAGRNGGTIDKVIGDAVVVLFSAPVDQADHAGLAIACALEMDRFATGFAREMHAQGTDFGETRIGVHSGSAIIGNFGGSGFFDYTALGDSMNTAARLESANRQFGTRIAVSGEAVRRCAGFHGRKIGKVVLKGKSLPVAVYEAVSEEDAAAPEYERYEEAYALLAEDESAARKAFASLARDCPGDGLVKFQLARLKAGESGEVIALTGK